MEKITNILVPFDFSESAKNALDFSIRFVHNDAIKINVLYITKSQNNSIEKLRDYYMRYCDQYERNLKLPIRWVLGWGNITDTIIEAQDEKHTELIIMGTSGLTSDKTITHTSVLVAKAKCPVIVVPETSGHMQIKRIVLLNDNHTIENLNILSVLLEIAAKNQAKVYVITVKSKEDNLENNLESINTDLLNKYFGEFYQEHTFVEGDDILEGVFKYTKDNDIDLIAVLPKHHATNTTPSEGKLTRELVLKSNIPVLTIE